MRNSKWGGGAAVFGMCLLGAAGQSAIADQPVFEKTITLKQALYDIWFLWDRFDKVPKDSTPGWYTYGLEPIFSKSVLTCQYEKGPIQYYWLNSEPEQSIDIKRKGPDPVKGVHVITGIGAPRSKCP